MKFEFCGNLDAPDWILAQLFHISRWDKEDFEIVCQSVKANMSNVNLFDEAKLFEKLDLYMQENDTDQIQMTRLDIDDVRACFGALDFILSNAKLHQVDELQLENELEQLGLASEHAKILCKHLNN